MICDICNKQKASVHLTEIINGEVTKMNLCEYCAKKRGNQMEQHFGIADLLQGLAQGSGAGKVATPKTRKLKCPHCAMTYDEFKKIGRLGCAGCYEAFHEHLSPLLRRIHGANRHMGKIPLGKAEKKVRKTKATGSSKVAKAQEDLVRLKMDLKKAVEDEAYEKAAAIRDRIRKIEGGVKNA